ncbi:hypothetical protein AB4209_02640 [Vibrio sp. 10N.286.48.C11]|uniref:hypothetical protein n=1 Tax=Vibrio sp. 10N.286.48.C11 TaxID=3229698 RepID=UPI00354C5685
MKILYIVRGPFGTGKTEFANTISDNVVSCWDYYARYGKNKYDENLKSYADRYCRESVFNLMKDNKKNIAVTNSFSKNSDLDYFYQAAQKHGYEVFSLFMDTKDSTKYKRDAPDDVVLKQIINLKNNVAYHQTF